MKSHIITFILPVMLMSCSGEKSHHPSPPPLSVSEVRDLGRMEFAEMTVSKMGTIDDLKLKDASTLNDKAAAIINALKIGTRKGAWSYDTYLRAFIDLSQLTEDDITIDTISRTAAVRLPRIETEITGRDIEMREEHYRVTGLRSDISAEERAALKESMNSMLKKEVASNAEFENSLRRKATERATAWIDSLFSSRGYTVSVTYK